MIHSFSGNVHEYIFFNPHRFISLFGKPKNVMFFAIFVSHRLRLD
jgi:hypothetical protein